MDRVIRVFRKVKAFLFRTFVTDCPRCYKYFYGFHPYGVQLKFDRHYRVVCHECADLHKKEYSKAV